MSGPTVTNITQELERCTLGELAATSANNLFWQTKVSQRYLSGVMDGSARRGLLQAPTEVDGLATLLAMRCGFTGPVEGGNQGLVQRLLQPSKAQLRSNTTVLGISSGKMRKYRITYRTQPAAESSLPHPKLDMREQDFDKVIIATPLHTANIDLGQVGDFNTASKTRGPDVHVTLFMTKTELSSRFFNLPDSTILPDDFLLTAHTSQTQDVHSISRSRECWIDKSLCFSHPSLPSMCDQMEYENLFRINSRGRVEDSDLVRMIGMLYQNNTPLEAQGISWVHRQYWPSAIPVNRHEGLDSPRLELAPGLFYLGGAEQVMSSMEMSCRMAKNVARLMLHEGEGTQSGSR